MKSGRMGKLPFVPTHPMPKGEFTSLPPSLFKFHKSVHFHLLKLLLRYARVATAHQKLGNTKKAKEAIVRALRRPDLENEPGLVNKLIELLTYGKGLSENEEEFLAWQELELVEDEENAEMMQYVQGLWKRRLEEHLAQLRTKH